MNSELARRHQELTREWRTRNEPFVNLLVERERLRPSQTMVVDRDGNVEFEKNEGPWVSHIKELMQMNRPPELDDIERLARITPPSATAIPSTPRR